MGILSYDRKKFFENLGTDVSKEQNLNDVLKAANLDYVVEKVRNYDPEGDPIDSYSTRYFDEDGNKHYLGTGLKKQYTVLQNYEAFDFLQDMLGDVVIEHAGEINKGRQTFICANTEPIKVLDEDIAPYITFINSHDGSSGVKVILTPIRVFCSNAVARAIKNAQSVFSIKHSHNVHSNLYIAKDILLKNTEYLKQYKETIEDMANVRFARREFVDKIIPFVLRQVNLLDENNNPVEKKGCADRLDYYRDSLLACWDAEDTKNQDNTLANLWNALTDFESHMKPMRNADNFEIPFRRVIQGMLLSNVALDYAATIKNYKFKY